MNENTKAQMNVNVSEESSTKIINGQIEELEKQIIDNHMQETTYPNNSNHNEQTNQNTDVNANMNASNTDENRSVSEHKD